jgi:hypothetical protein
VIDRGNMPLAKLVFDAFWGANSNKPETLARFLEGEGFANVRDANGAVLQPGRPIADPGPDRVVTQKSTTLSAAGSLFADTYAWSIVSGPNGSTPSTSASLTDANSAQPTFTATVDGTYLLQLVAGKGALKSAPAPLTIVVNSALSPAPDEVRFSHIQTVLQKPGEPCTKCHKEQPAVKSTPVFYEQVDYDTIRGRINFTDIVASPLLRKPSGKHHGAGNDPRPGFNASLAPGVTGRENYDLFLNWILNGALEK